MELNWVPDVLGGGFECTTFDLGPDDDPTHTVAQRPEQQTEDHGEEQVVDHPHLVATLVRSLPAPRDFWGRFSGHRREFEDVDVLYVHGWSDYFFQKSLAAFWTSRGARFFALDLRRYGRSLRPGQTPGYITNLDDYDAEIDLAVEEIHRSRPIGEPGRKFVLLGHSTGGLVLSLWASRHEGEADALVLNSPWLELQLSARGRQLVAPIVHLGARLNPFEAGPQFDLGFYSRAQAEVGPKSELEGVNRDWRPEQTHTVHSGWLSAIIAGHERVAAGLGIEVPVCVLLSAHSEFRTRWTKKFTSSDSVLDVEAVARAALHLGQSVSIEWIDGALHDVFLSAEKPRAEAYARLERWTRGWLAGAAR